MDNFNNSRDSSSSKSLEDKAKKFKEEANRAIDQELDKRGFDRDSLMSYYENLPADMKEYLDQEFKDLIFKEVEDSKWEGSDLEALKKIIETQDHIKSLCPVDISVSYAITEKNIKEKSQRKKGNRYRRWV